MKPSILAVIVLYETAAHDSVSVASLVRAIEAATVDSLRLQVVLVDNSPTGNAAPGIFEKEVYVPVSTNAGLAHAYNMGLRIAQERGIEWLLTLDQDTSLPTNFLSGLADAISLVNGDPQVAAVVPQMQVAGRAISPYIFRWGALPTWFPQGHTGVSTVATYALNSASVLRVSALRQVGGYDPRFWLDASDHAIFHALAAHGKSVFVAGNVQVQHQLSVLDENDSMSAARYENYVAAESAFWDLNMCRLANWERTARLAVRLIRQLRRGQTELRRISVRYLGLRLLHTRRYRLQIWERGLTGRAGDFAATGALTPIVSVCMASYNSERYIEEQIRSILPQLRPSDELVVVDDASSDSTRERILGFDDPRIRLIKQAENRGVVETFEHAVRSAVGDILFLCDGDDIWANDKVAKVLRAFGANSKAGIVCTGLKLIGENGEVLERHDHVQGGAFSASVMANLVRNRFQGSAMAFRSQLLARILPFPKRRLFLHDAWIGLCNAISGGDTVYLADPLLYYRRHSSNVSQRMGLKEQILKRVQLMAALTTHWLRSR